VKERQIAAIKGMKIPMVSIRAGANTK